MDNLVLLSDTEIALYYIIFSTGPCRRDGLVVREGDWQSIAHGFESHCWPFQNCFQFPLPHLILPVFFGRDFAVLAMCNYRQCSS